MNVLRYTVKVLIMAKWGKKMKRVCSSILFLSVISGTIFSAAKKQLEEIKVVIEPKWEDLEHDSKKVELFGGKLILIGSITLKKRMKDPIYMHQIQLHWNGNEIENINGSLYQKQTNKEFMPIEEYLVCDGIWNKSKQRLILEFEQEKKLNSLNIFYLVLTIPNQLEEQLKTGTFEIEKYCLPEPIQACTKNQTLSIAVNSRAAEISPIAIDH